MIFSCQIRKMLRRLSYSINKSAAFVALCNFILYINCLHSLIKHAAPVLEHCSVIKLYIIAFDTWHQVYTLCLYSITYIHPVYTLCLYCYTIYIRFLHCNLPTVCISGSVIITCLWFDIRFLHCNLSTAVYSVHPGFLPLAHCSLYALSSQQFTFGIYIGQLQFVFALCTRSVYCHLYSFCTIVCIC